MMKKSVTSTEKTSAATTDHQTPSRCQIIGMTSTIETWNKSVLRKEISAETSPLLSAVNIDEPKIENPQKRKASE